MLGCDWPKGITFGKNQQNSKETFWRSESKGKKRKRRFPRALRRRTSLPGDYCVLRRQRRLLSPALRDSRGTRRGCFDKTRWKRAAVSGDVVRLFWRRPDRRRRQFQSHAESPRRFCFGTLNQRIRDSQRRQRHTADIAAFCLRLQFRVLAPRG